MKRHILILATLLIGSSLQGAEPDFTKDIAPILTKYCAGCHNPTAFEGKLSLDSFAGAMKGGAKGAAITPGAADQSRLIRVLTGAAKPVMPPEGEEAPKPADVALLKAWIDAGAKGPTGKAADPADLATPKIKPTIPIRSSINALAASPKGDIVALAKHGEIELISAADGATTKKLTGHRGRVNAVAFSADGKQLASGAGEPALFGEIKVWNVETGECQTTWRGHRDAVYAVAIAPDGQTIASGSYDASIILWRPGQNDPQRTLDAHNGAVFAVAFRNDGKILASASEDRTVKLWNVADGTRLDTLSQSTKELYTLAFSPDGQQVAAAGVDNRIRLWSISPTAKEGTNPLVLSQFAHEAAVLRLAYSTDGQTLMTTGEDRLIKVWNAANLTIRATLPPQPDWVSGVAVINEQRDLIASRLDGRTERFSLAQGNAANGPALTPLDEVPPEVTYAPPAAEAPPVAAEAEPNDAPGQAQPLPLPGKVKGAIHVAGDQRPRDFDLYKFTAQAGDQWIFETNAARSGSQLDSKLEILFVDGRPVPRLLLRALRDSEIEFRGMNSDQRGARLKYWEEIPLRQYVYIGGEVVKHFQQRRGPDADNSFYPEGGSRTTYFETTAKTHALGEPAYVVAPYPVGTQFPNNGLPVFTVHFENDDDAQRKLGKDSRLTFVAPADGDYLIRVGDVRGFSGEKFIYELSARRPQPGFKASVVGANPTVGAASGKLFTVKADRSDNFNGPVRVEVTGAPPGFTVTSPLVIEAGHNEAKGVIAALATAAGPTEADWSKVKVVATADIAGKTVTQEVGNLGTVKLAEKPKVVVDLLPTTPLSEPPSPGEFRPIPEISIVPGQETTIRLKVERRDFNQRIPIEVENLPHGVIVNDIGLSGVLINETETERVVFLHCEPWVADQDRLFVAAAKVEGDQVSLPMLLKVRKK